MMDGVLSRRGFFTRPFGTRGSGRATAKTAPLRPPWALAPVPFATACPGRGSAQGAPCHACVQACPLDILALDAEGRPVHDPSKGGCDFCGDCVRACPSGALEQPAMDQGRAPWHRTLVVDDLCLTKSGVVCRSCGEACPSRAITFPPEAGAVAAPRIDTDACSGCGACLAPCPVGALTLAVRER